MTDQYRLETPEYPEQQPESQPERHDGPTGDGSDPGAAAGTGDPHIDAAMARLGGLGGLPAVERVAEYEAVHRTLQDTLATVDDA